MAIDVWCVLAFTLLFGAIFSFLAWDVFLDFRRVVRDPHFTAMAGNDKHAWAQLFMGAAGSAFFAVVLVVVFAVCAIYYMLLHRKGLSHPVQNFGRGFLVALSFMGCLHIANIATHFLSFAPAMGHWIVDYKVDFNRVLLDSTFVVGYASSLFFLAFALLLLFWRRTDVDISYQEIPPN
eukprot:jgi/Astpho2/5301/Aster-05860